MAATLYWNASTKLYWFVNFDWFAIAARLCDDVGAVALVKGIADRDLGGRLCKRRGMIRACFY